MDLAIGIFQNDGIAGGDLKSVDHLPIDRQHIDRFKFGCNRSVRGKSPLKKNWCCTFFLFWFGAGPTSPPKFSAMWHFSQPRRFERKRARPNVALTGSAVDCLSSGFFSDWGSIDINHEAYRRFGFRYIADHASSISSQSLAG